MANSLWLYEGKLVVDDDGALIMSPVCPCGVPCDRICTYCCETELLSQYTLTLPSSFRLLTCDNSDPGILVAGPWTVHYMGTDDNDYCIWNSDGVAVDSGWLGAVLQYDPAEGDVFGSIIYGNTPDMAAWSSGRTCCSSYPYNCETVTAPTYGCAVQWDNTASAPDYCQDALSLTLGNPQNFPASCSPCSGGAGTTLTIS